MFKEFKEFALRGNVIDLAVGVIIGGAFGSIVNSLVADVITPLLLNPSLKAAGVDNIKELAWNGVKYGNFLSTLISFILIAFSIFMLVKLINNFHKIEGTAASPTQEELLQGILEELRKR